MVTECRQTKASRPFLRRAAGFGVLITLLLGMAVERIRAEEVQPVPEADTYMASGRATQSFGSRTVLWVGCDQDGGDLIEQSLLAFAPAALPPQGSAIVSAKLWLYSGSTTLGDTSMTVRVHRVRSDWDETTATWQQRPTFDSTPGASASIPALSGWYSWDVRALLQAWSDSRDTSSFSLLLQSDVTSGQHERGFRSREHSAAGFRPYLDVVYDSLTPPATGTSTPTSTRTPTPTATATPTPTGAWAMWREPNTLISLPSSRTVAVVLDYYNAPPSTELLAIASGAAVFRGDGQPQLKDSVRGSGVYVLTLKAAAGARPGDAFSLSAQVGGFVLRPSLRSGRIAPVVYVPIVLLNSIPPPSPTPTRTRTPAATSTRTPTATSTRLPAPAAPALSPITPPEANPSYVVRWSVAARAESYVLERATGPGFGDAVQMYAGPATEQVVPSAGIATYYYRVKARNAVGESGWSSVQSVAVRWELEPNGEAVDATRTGALQKGANTYGVLTGADERGNDYFYLDLLSPGKVELWLTNMTLGQDFNLVLRDASLMMVAGGYSGNVGSSDEHIAATPLAAGRYYVQVRRVTGDSTHPYQLRGVW